jgi:Flp pilus assembly secretin CpaC
MTRQKISAAWLAAVIAVIWFVAVNRAPAAELNVTSSDANARFMVLGVSKSVVIDLPTDLKDVLVADNGVVNAIVQSRRRVYLIGSALGQTNVYFFDADGRQIGALNIAVVATSQPADSENSPIPANVIVVFRGTAGQTLSCTPTRCVDATKPGSDLPPGTQNINVTGSTSVIVSAK